MTIKEIVKKYKGHPFWGIYGGSVWSAIVTTAFAVYNIFLFVFFKSVWHVSAGVYFALLAAARCILMTSEWKNYHENDEKICEKRSKKTFFCVSVFTILINIALLAPVAVMAFGGKVVNTDTIAAITVATYTVYKIIAAIIRYNKSKKSDSLALMQLREIALCDALFSILSLQNTLISTFSEGQDSSMFRLSIISSVSIVGIIVAVSLTFAVREIRNLKKKTVTDNFGDRENNQ